MEILGNDGNTFGRAVRLVEANPNPAHVEEYRVVTGVARDIGGMLDDSLEASAVVACAERDGEAMVGGVTFQPAEGVLKHQIWMLTTAGAPEHPRWLLREGRRLLDMIDRYFKWPYGYVQAIPITYPQGVNYARHMGFRVLKSVVRGDVEIVLMERMIPRWVQ